MYLSILLFVIFTVTLFISGWRKFFYSIFYALFWVVSWIYLFANYYTGEWFNESLIYHLKSGIGWFGLQSESHIIIASIIFIVIYIIIWFAIFYIGSKYWKKKIWPVFWITALVLSFVFHPLSSNLYTLYGKNIGSEMYDTLIVQSSFTTNSWPHRPWTLKEYFQDIYSEPQNTSLREIEKKDFIVIYLESYEKTFLSTDIFPNLSNWLNTFALSSKNYSNIHQAYGTSWTMWGMVWSQCGIPLVHSKENDGGFLAGSTCIGDILSENWYDLQYVGGAKKSFADKDSFYTSHSFDSIEWAEEIDSENTYDWWEYDDTIFSHSLEKIKNLEQQQDPYGLFMLTMDTHGKNWVMSDACKIKYSQDESILNSYFCTDSLVSNFIDDARNINPDLHVFLISDHYAMNHSETIDILNEFQNQRRILFLSNDGVSVGTDILKEWNTYDVAPTILWDLWFETERLWYGINLSSELTSVQWVYNTGLPRFNTFLKEQISAQLRNKQERQSQIDEEKKAKQEKSHEQEKKIILENTLIKEAIAKELEENYEQQKQVIMALEREQVKILESEKNIFSQIKNKRIAHAWWAYKGKTYTNSLDSLNANKDTYEIFEIDLSWTADDKLVCIHDWLWGPENHLWIYDTNNTVLDYKEFNTLATSYKDYTACNLESLINWLKNNPNTFLVPDIKEKNVEALKVISKKYPEMQDRIIAQIYQPNEYQQIWNTWYKNIIWTTYKYTGTNKQILLELAEMDVVALAMDTTRMENGLAQMTSSAWYYTYVHTLNSTEELQIAQNAWVDEIITDFLK